MMRDDITGLPGANPYFLHVLFALTLTNIITDISVCRYARHLKHVWDTRDVYMETNNWIKGPDRLKMRHLNTLIERFWSDSERNFTPLWERWLVCLTPYSSPTKKKPRVCIGIKDPPEPFLKMFLGVKCTWWMTCTSFWSDTGAVHLRNELAV